jgi:hypothetical protein
VLGAVDELDGECLAGARPFLIGLPNVVVPAGLPVRVQAAISCWFGCGWIADRFERVTGHLLQGGEAFREDIQALVAGQAELERDGAAGCSCVECRSRLDRRVIAAKVIDHVVGALLAGLVAGQVEGGEGQGVRADRFRGDDAAQDADFHLFW